MPFGRDANPTSSRPRAPLRRSLKSEMAADVGVVGWRVMVSGVFLQGNIPTCLIRKIYSFLPLFFFLINDLKPPKCFHSLARSFSKEIDVFYAEAAAAAGLQDCRDVTQQRTRSRCPEFIINLLTRACSFDHG